MPSPGWLHARSLARFGVHVQTSLYLGHYWVPCVGLLLRPPGPGSLCKHYLPINGGILLHSLLSGVRVLA